MPSRSNLAPFTSRSGFSLVEVLIAIGIVTFAMLVVFSMMPVGMASLQASNRQIVETEIFNTIGGELAATPFDQLTAYADPLASIPRFPVCFDQEGVEVPQTSAHVFAATCSLAPTELATGTSTGELRRATVSIYYQVDPATVGAKPVKRTFLLVNQGS